MNLLTLESVTLVDSTMKSTISSWAKTAPTGTSFSKRFQDKVNFVSNGSTGKLDLHDVDLLLPAYIHRLRFCYGSTIKISCLTISDLARHRATEVPRMSGCFQATNPPCQTPGTPSRTSRWSSCQCHHTGRSSDRWWTCRPFSLKELRLILK